MEARMNYTEARAFIDQISAKGSLLGLGPITNLLSFLGNPQDELKFIHVAGTNGKGSVLAYLASVLQEAGYLVGRYISPTLFSYRERIQVNQEYIGREEFAALVTRTAEAIEKMKEHKMALPTVFEVETAVSFLYFAQRKCDLVLLEVGMGGRLDATNVIQTPVLTVLTSISMDHMAFLGDTLGEIAWNKAGIFKQGVQAVCAQQDPEAEMVIRDVTGQVGCPCTFADWDMISDVRYGLWEQSFSYGEFEDVKIRLAGPHQIQNATLALACIRALRCNYAIPDTAVKKGMYETTWKGRFTPICRNPLIILDGAHNPDAALRLRSAIEQYFPDRKKYYIFGVFSDKEYDKIIEITAGLAEHIITVATPDNPRALPADALAQAVRRVNPSVEPSGSIREAVEKSLALAGQEDVIVIFGSLSFLALAEQAVQECTKRQ